MKTLLMNLQDSVGNTYDPTRTTTLGRAAQKNSEGLYVIGPPLTKAIDVYTDTLAGGAVVPLYMHTTPNGRLFMFSAISGGVGTLLYYTFDLATGEYEYKGRILYTVAPGTAVTIRGGVVDDFGAYLKIWVGTIATGMVYNGGLFRTDLVALSDFAKVGFITVPLANDSGQRATYKCDDPAYAGVLNLLTTTAGLAIPYDAEDAGVNKRVVVMNNTAALPNAHIFDGTDAPVFTRQTCTSPTTNASPTFTMTGHGYANGMALVIVANAPGGFTLTVTTQTAYIVRNVTEDTFELATVAAPTVSLNCTTAVTPTLGRAYGVCTNQFVHKTGTLPALGAGTILLTDAVGYCRPGHGLNANQDCVFVSTTTNLYIIRISELTSGATLLPNLDGCNLLGSGIDVVAPAAAYAAYCSACDVAVFNTQTAAFVIKKIQNNAIIGAIGYLSNQYIETLNPITVPPALVAVAGMDMRAGWLFISGSTAGQRVIIALDLRSDDYFDYSKVISPVVYVGHSKLKYLNTIEKYFDETDSISFFIRTSAHADDSVFSTADDGWVQAYTAQDLSSIALEDYVQTMALFGNDNTPAQIHDFELTVLQDNKLSYYWEGSTEHTSRDGESPAYSAFRLVLPYVSAVPKLYFRAYSDDGTLVASANTVDNSDLFTYSANNGTSWSALGTIPNTPFTTELRYHWATPPGVRVTISMREE